MRQYRKFGDSAVAHFLFTDEQGKDKPWDWRQGPEADRRRKLIHVYDRENTYEIAREVMTIMTDEHPRYEFRIIKRETTITETSILRMSRG